MKKFNIKGVGLDSTGLMYELSDSLYFDYIHTSIEAGNEDFISRWTRSNPSAPLVTSIGFLDSRATLIGHLNILGRNIIDLLLVDSSCDFQGYAEILEEEVEDEIVGEVGIRNPKSVEQLEEIRKYFNFTKVALDICPLNFDFEIIKWCKENEVGIIGFNPFGGNENSGNLIKSFGIQYLLGFSSKYSDLLLLPGNDPYNACDCAILLNGDYIPAQSDTEEDEYSMNRTIHKLGKPLKKVISSSIKLDDKITIPYNLPNTIVGLDEIQFSFGKSEESIETQEQNELQKSVSTFLEQIKEPEDVKSLRELFSSYKLRVLEYLGTKVSYDHLSFLTVGETASAIVIRNTKLKRKLFGEYKEVLISKEVYALYMDPKKKLYFLKLNNAAEEA